MDKACPVVLRSKDNKRELLAFKHPTAGVQLVKGGLKKGEDLASACIRELKEESGIQAQVVKHLGVWTPGYKNQTWGFCLMHFEDKLPDTWTFATKDDGGQLFSFFWQPLHGPLNNQWNEVYTGAFKFIKHALGDYSVLGGTNGPAQLTPIF